jgi:hypothetical protein
VIGVISLSHGSLLTLLQHFISTVIKKDWEFFLSLYLLIISNHMQSRGFGFETFSQYLGVTLNGFLSVISSVCGMRELHALEKINMDSKNSEHPRS